MGGFFSDVGSAIGGIGGTAGKGVISGAAGLLGLQDPFAKGPPSLEQAQLDPHAAEILRNRTEDYTRPTSENSAIYKKMANDSNNGVQDARSLLQGGNANSPMSAALLKRQNKQFSSLSGKMKQSDLADAPLNRASQIAGTIGSIQNEAADAANFAQKQKQVEQNKQFARNNAINNILRSTGALAGAYFGGAPGAALGQGIGAAVGDQSARGGNMSYLSGGLGG